MADRPVTAVVLAAGDGARMLSPTPKVLLEIARVSGLERSVRAFEATLGVDGIVVVAHPDSVTTMAGLLEGIGKVEAVVPGGSTRSASTLTALDTIEHADGLVLVHDAARPLVTSELISAVLAALASADAATVAVPADDTMLRVHDGAVIDIPDRSKLWHAQTPQGFRLETLRAAYRAAGNSPDFTDDCSIVARHLPGVAISVVPGSPRNLKITHPGDIAAAERFLAGNNKAD